MWDGLERLIAVLPPSARAAAERIARSGPDGPVFTLEELADAAAALEETPRDAAQASFKFARGVPVMK